ncbi:hypothetical protein BDV12DRAFT_166581 [Aspergillus spectabilis]
MAISARFNLTGSGALSRSWRYHTFYLGLVVGHRMIWEQYFVCCVWFLLLHTYVASTVF